MSHRLAPGKPPVWKEPATQETITLELGVITPMFGGGADARRVDPETPIRAAGIRGQLRFWWRATAGAQCTDPSELFAREAEIWGRIAGKEGLPGKVALKVQILDAGQKTTGSGGSAQQGPKESYFLFPFREGKTEAIEHNGVRFALTVSFPTSERAVVERTLRAWITFGGVGARNRRGCGSLTVLKEPELWLPPAEKREDWFATLCSTSLAEPKHTSLAGAVIVTGKPSTPRQVWSGLGTFWARFRKGHYGPDGYEPMRGCRWDDFRRALPTYQDEMGEEIALAKPFFGLPIIYQKFNDVPYAPTIISEKTERMASPIILKPLALANGQFLPMVAVLQAPAPKAIRIDGQEVTLRYPTNDRVLEDLKASDLLDAVIRAAEQDLNGTRWVAGGQP